MKLIRKNLPEINIIGVGHSKYAGKVNELDSFFFLNSDDENQTASIFIEDQSLAFDYAHILPLVEKCSILHGHTSTVMVEIIGNLNNNNLVIDFGHAKRIIKEALNIIDHKFFISKKYLQKEDDFHYHISFEGPKGYFSLQLPKLTTFLLSGESYRRKSFNRNNQVACAENATKCRSIRCVCLRRRQQRSAHNSRNKIRLSNERIKGTCNAVWRVRLCNLSFLGEEEISRRFCHYFQLLPKN